ncbi:hypothetical protein N9F93_01010 [bacterium]|nr:hypothetical protein [bacterium]MDA8988821.1 hypothetical protein [bacterium]
MSNPQIVIAKTEKSVGISLILTLLFGPLGMLYSTVMGGLVMIAVTILVGLFTFGFGLVFLWPVYLIWGALAASSHNQKLHASAR